MQPSLPDLREPLSDGVIALRLSAERDIPEILIAHQDDPELYIRIGEERPPSGAELGRRSERAEIERLGGRRAELTIVEPGSDVCVGMVSVSHLDWLNARGEVGVWLAPQVRSRGYAPRALILTARWLFEACRLERVELLTQPDNQAMIASARRAGFQLEGVLRGYTLERGARTDLAIMSLLPSDLES
jgi:RimJ/RimL family protein N-acetyltransferase